MRRFSQRNSLVTLNEINITPLLDLAFVLLIIFIITTPILEQSLPLNLPSTSGAPDSGLRKDDVRIIDVSPQGNYLIRNKPFTLPQLEAFLASEFRNNPKLAIYIRADKKEQYENVINLLDVCRRLNIKRIDFATSAKK